MSAKIKMVFNKTGNVRQLKIETSKDLEAVLHLDKALWVATGAPINMINCDKDFLNYLDKDNNDRIISYEIKEAIRWTLKMLTIKSGITQKSSEIFIENINALSEDGKKIKSSIKKMLNQLNCPKEKKITLNQIRDIKKKLKETPVSEKGTILPETAKEPEIKKFIEDIIDTTDGVSHPSGKKGITESHLNKFIEEASLLLKWIEEGKNSDIMPLEKKTLEAYKYFNILKEKINYYFAYCKINSYNKTEDKILNYNKKQLNEIDITSTVLIDEFGKSNPIAKPEKNCKLILSGKINPYYETDLNDFFSSTVKPILKKTVKAITEKDWGKIKSFFTSHEKWTLKKPDTKVYKLQEDQIEQYLNIKYTEAIKTLIKQNEEASIIMDNIGLTEKLCLFQMTIIDFANNFISFPHLYSPASQAMFEMGTLVIDGRHLTFSVKVTDRLKHSKLAATSNIFILYAKIFKPQGDFYEIALPVTAGGKGNLCVGKRGIFFDINNNEYDAVIVQIIENPISLRETLFSPFHRIAKLISGKFESMTTTAEEKLDLTTSSTISQPIQGGQQQQQNNQNSNKGLMTGGVIMGGSVAIAALSSALAYITKTLSSVDPIAIVIGLSVAVLAVIAPASIIAFIKLKKRDLSSILEGAGWSINARMRLTLKLGKVFTVKPKYPKKIKIQD